MKISDIKKHSYIVFLILLILIVLLRRAFSILPSSKPAYFTLQNTFTCEERDGVMDRISVFGVNKTISICTQVNSVVENLHKQMQICIYNGKQDILETPIYYENVWVSNGEMVIPLDVYIPPGNYEIQITDGRIILSTLKIEIIEK